jgi:hypothetical protein
MWRVAWKYRRKDGQLSGWCGVGRQYKTEKAAVMACRDLNANANHYGVFYFIIPPVEVTEVGQRSAD